MIILSSGKDINMDSKRLGIISSVIIIFLILVSAFVSAADRASFGAIIKPVTADYAQFIGLDTPEGAYVVSTLDAGDLRPGDVILKVDDRGIKSPADLIDVIKIYQPGDKVMLQIARGKKRINISYTLKGAPVLSGKVRPAQPTQDSYGLYALPTVESERFEQEVLKSDQPVLAYFYAKWCSPCKTSLPIMQQVKKQHPEVKIVGIDVDKSRDIVNRYGISGLLPAVILFKDGREVDKVSPVSRKEMVDRLLAKIRKDRNETEVSPAIGRGNWVLQVAFIKDSHLIVARASQRIVVWDYWQGALVRTYSSAITALSPNGTYVAMTDEDNTAIHILNVVQQQQKSIQTQQFVEKLAISPFGTVVACFGADRNGQFSVNIWSKDNRLIKSIPIDHQITSIQSVEFVFSPDGSVFALSTLNKLELFSTENWERITVVQMKGAASELKFTSDSKSIIAHGYEKVLIDLQGKKQSIDFAAYLDRTDDRLLIIDKGDNSFRLVSNQLNGKELRFVGHRAPVITAALSDTALWIASGSADGTVRLWDQTTGREVAQFVDYGNGEWIVITPEGYFNASPNGAKHLNVRVGNNVYSIDNFYEKFFNPVYVASVLQGKKVEAVADIRKGILTPPDVRIISPEPNATFSTDTITIMVSAKDTGGGIDEIRLYHNGKVVGEDTRAVKIVPKGDEAVKTYTVTLVDGINTFRATAFSKDRTESNPYELIVKLTAPSKDVNLYVLAIGINKYKNPALNLNYAVPDAKAIAGFFKERGSSLFKKVEIIEVYDDMATKENIVSRLKQLKATQPQDAVLLYLAGHGDTIDDRWYFIPYEVTYPEREEDVKTKGISSDEFSGYIKEITAQKILVLLDACKSGAVMVAFRGFEDRKALSQLSRSTGVHIIAASTKDQFAAEVKDLGHGVFTYTLLEGLKGRAAGGSKAVTVFKLKAYIDEQLPEITKKYKQEAQYPIGDTRGMDFPLVLIK